MGKRFIRADQIPGMGCGCAGLSETDRSRCDDRTVQTKDRLGANRANRPCGNKQVENGADRQTADQTDRYVALRILGLLRSRRNGIETDIGEEDRGRRTNNAHTARAFRSEPPIRREGREVALIQRWQRQRDKGGQRRDLDRDQHRVDPGAFRRADDEQGRDGERDNDRRDIDDAMGKIGMGDEAVEAPGRPR